VSALNFGRDVSGHLSGRVPIRRWSDFVYWIFPFVSDSYGLFRFSLLFSHYYISVFLWRLWPS